MCAYQTVECYNECNWRSYLRYLATHLREVKLRVKIAQSVVSVVLILCIVCVLVTSITGNVFFTAVKIVFWQDHRVPFRRCKPLLQKVILYCEEDSVLHRSTEKHTNISKKFKMYCRFYRFSNIKNCQIQAVFHDIIKISCLNHSVSSKCCMSLQTQLVTTTLLQHE